MISINRKSFSYIDQCFLNSWPGGILSDFFFFWGGGGGERRVVETVFMTLFQTKTCHMLLGPLNPYGKIILWLCFGFCCRVSFMGFKRAG